MPRIVRIVWLMSLLSGVSMSAFAGKGHYSVQVLSRAVGHSRPFDMARMPSECYTVVRDGFEAVRCGCTPVYREAVTKLLAHYRKRFSQAFVSNCDVKAFRAGDRYRMKGMAKENDTKTVASKTDASSESEEHRFKKRYAVQILSVPVGSGLPGRKLPATGCYKASRRGFDAVRCGCYDRYRDALRGLKHYKKSYPTAFVTFCDPLEYERRALGASPASEARIRTGSDEDAASGSANMRSETRKPKPAGKGRERKKGAPDKKMIKKSKQAKGTKDAEKPDGVKETLLDKMYKSFVYGEDLKHAREVVDLALRRNGDSVKWLKRSVDINMWLGDSDRAMAAMEALYRRTGDAGLRKKLIDYALERYQYQKALYLMLDIARDRWRPKDYLQVSQLYNLVGEPGKARDLLVAAWKAYPGHRTWLLDALQLSIDMGDIDGAGRIVRILEKEGFERLRGVRLAAYYHFVERDLERSYRVLADFDVSKLRDMEEKRLYYRTLSDTAWLAGAYRKALEGSLFLIEHDAAKKEDYDRALMVLSRDNKEKAIDIALRALRRYKETPYFYTAAYLAQDIDNKSAIGDALVTAREAGLQKSLEKDAAYWLLAGGWHMYMGRLDGALADMRMAHALAPDDIQVLSQLIWFYYDRDMVTEMAKLAAELERKDEIDIALLPPLIAIEMKLQRADRARYYMDQLMKRRKEQGLNHDERAGMAYLLQQQMRIDYYKQMMYRLYQDLEKERREHPEKMKEALFADAWLRAAMEFVNPDDYESRLAEAEHILSKSRYKELTVLWLLRQAFYEQAHLEMVDWPDVEPWMILSLALYDYDLSLIQKMIYRHGTILPIRDRVEAARRDHQVAVAQSLAYRGMEENRWDYLLYYQREQLMREESDRYLWRHDFENREILDRYRTVFVNRNSLPRGWILREELTYVHNKKLDDIALRHVPSEQKGIDVALVKRFERGDLLMRVGYRHAMADYLRGDAAIAWRLSQRWSADAALHFREDTDDTTYLMLGGYRNRLHASLDYQLLTSTVLQGYGDWMRYEGADGEDAGKGWKAGVSAFRAVRTGYPDIQWSVYMELGRFDRKIDQKGLLAEVIPEPHYDTATPGDFMILGGNLAIGYQNQSTYVRAWRPYLNISPYYDFEVHQGSVGGEIGIGGSLLQQDHMNLGVRYMPAFYKGQDDLLTLYMHYRMMY